MINEKNVGAQRDIETEHTAHSSINFNIKLNYNISQFTCTVAFGSCFATEAAKRRDNRAMIV